MSVNSSAVVKGFLGSDPKIVSLPTGDMGTFSVAVTHQHKKNDEVVKNTSWFEVVVFKNIAVDFCVKNLKKGSLVIVEGEIKDNVYEKEGEKITKKQIYVTNHFGDVCEVVKSSKSQDEDVPF